MARPNTCATPVPAVATVSFDSGARAISRPLLPCAKTASTAELPGYSSASLAHCVKLGLDGRRPRSQNEARQGHAVDERPRDIIGLPVSDDDRDAPIFPKLQSDIPPFTPDHGRNAITHAAADR
jgi:hypothetical protein